MDTIRQQLSKLTIYTHHQDSTEEVKYDSL